MASLAGQKMNAVVSWWNRVLSWSFVDDNKTIKIEVHSVGDVGSESLQLKVSKSKPETANQTFCPKWNEKLEVTVQKVEQRFVLELLEKNAMGINTKIGELELFAKDFTSEGSGKKKLYPLTNDKKAAISTRRGIALTYWLTHQNKTKQFSLPDFFKKKEPILKKESFHIKLDMLYEGLKGRTEIGNDTIHFKASKASIIDDVQNAISRLTESELLTSNLNFRFEDGKPHDWMYLFVQSIKCSTIFKSVRNQRYAITFNPNCKEPKEEVLEYLETLGVVIGMAIIRQRYLEIYFTRPILKMMLESKVTVRDFINSFEEIVGSEVVKNDGEQSDNIGADLVYKELKEEVISSMKEPVGAIVKGLTRLIPIDHIKIFDAFELELLFCGVPDIEKHHWMEKATDWGFEKNEETVTWLWKIVDSFDTSTLAKFHQLITGSSRFCKCHVCQKKELCVMKATQDAFPDDSQLPFVKYGRNNSILFLREYTERGDLDADLKQVLYCRENTNV